MKTHLTPFQLFFLSFLYVFSGLVLCNADSLFALLVPFAGSVLWALVGYRGATKKRIDFADFLSEYLPKKETPIPISFFLFTSAAEAVTVLFDAGISLGGDAEFIPYALVLGILLGIAIFACVKGVTVLGRFSETVLFLLVPIILLHLFGKFTPMETIGNFSGFRLVFSVMPAPIFFLLSQTTVSGDEGISSGFRATETPPKNRAGFLVKIVIAGAAFAIILRAGLLMFPFGETELLLYFLEYMAHTVKLSLLLAVCAHNLKKKHGYNGAIYSVVLVSAVVFTLAVLGGAVFSPFLWIVLLVCLNVTVGAMLGAFSFR